MNTLKYFLFSLFLVTSFSPALTAKRKLTMDEAVMGLYTTLAPKKINTVKWIPPGNSFSYILTTEPEVLHIYDASTLKETAQINIKDVDGSMSSASQLAQMEWTSSTEFIYLFQNVIHRYDIRKKKRTDLAEIAENKGDMAFSTDHKFLFYTMGESLVYTELSSQEKPLIIAESNSLDITYGQTVSRREYGITGGLFPSPKGRYLAFYKKDQSQVKDYPIIDWSQTPAVPQNIKYPMAGGLSETVWVQVYDTETKKTLTLNIDNSKNNYIATVTWSPDEKYIYATILNRSTTRASLNKYNARTGEFVKNLITESSEKYVEPQHDLHFINDEDFIYQSDRSGYNHLYLYEASSGKLKQITKGKWQVNKLLGYNPASRAVIFSGSRKDPREEHIYFSSIDQAETFRLDKEPGWHSAILSPNSAYLFDSYSSANVPSSSRIYQLDLKKDQLLSASRDPLDSLETANVQEVTIRAEDGTVLYGQIMTPANMDRSKKHPTIVYLYNGPHVQLVKHRYPASGNLWYDYLCSQGYVVFVMDGRGSSNRGRDFEQATYRQLGEVEAKDQIKGLQYLLLQDYVDASRVGIHGWSFGGFMTTNMMLKYPEIFRAGVAGGPVMDWSMYEVMYTERYMDTPEENPEGYAKTKLLDKVDQLKGKLLLIHGTDDDIVVWQHSIKFIQECVDIGVQVDYFVYPGHPHNVRGKDRIHLMQKVTDYFDLHLKGAEL